MTTELKKPRKTIAPTPDSPDFLAVVNELDILSQATTGLAEIEAAANGKLLELITEYKKDYAKFQLAATTAETNLEKLCRAHPEWFSDKKKSITTPYGKVSFHKSTKLVVKDAEATVRLLLAKQALSESQHNLDGVSPVFRAAPYINKIEVPNIEALEVLTDVELDEFLIKRELKDNFSATPATVNFGKAVTEAAKTAAN